MRILILNDLATWRLGGAVGMAFRIARELRRQGHDARFFATVQDRGEAGTREEDGVPTTAVWTRYPLRFRAYVGLRNPRVLPALRETLAAFRPDVVHAHNVHTYLSYASLDCAAATGAPVILTAHDVMLFCYKKMDFFLDQKDILARDRPDYRHRPLRCLACQRFRYFPLRNVLIRRVLRRSVTRLLAVSDELRRVLEINGIPGATVVPNALDTRVPPPSEEAVRAFRARFALEGKRVVLHGGRMSRLKGGDALLRAFGRAAPGIPDAHLLLLGDSSPYTEHLLAMAGARNLRGRVTVTGWLEGEELEAAYASAQVLAAPSLCFDTFGLFAAEGALRGLAVIGSSFGGMREVVEDGVTGYVVNPLDESALARRLAELLCRPERARAMGEAGRRRIETMFRLEVQVARLLQIYEEAMRDQRGARGAPAAGGPRETGGPPDARGTRSADGGRSEGAAADAGCEGRRRPGPGGDP